MGLAKRLKENELGNVINDIEYKIAKSEYGKLEGAWILSRS